MSEEQKGFIVNQMLSGGAPNVTQLAVRIAKILFSENDLKAKFFPLRSGDDSRDAASLTKSKRLAFRKRDEKLLKGIFAYYSCQEIDHYFFY